MTIEIASDEETHNDKVDIDYQPNVSEKEEESDDDQEDESKSNEKLKNIHRKVTHCCPYDDCDATFSKKVRLETHIRMKHTNYLPYQCSQESCKATFACQTYLNKHLARHDLSSQATQSRVNEKSRPSQSECSLCSQTFRSKHQLRTHQLENHSDQINVAAFICETCGARFSLRSRLSAHQRRHRGYRCTYPECNFSVDKWSDLRKHLAAEHRKLECSICRKRYSTSYNLKVHEEAVHSEAVEKVARFACPHEDCERVYVRESSLRIHQKTYHSAEPRYACPYSLFCDRRFRHKKSLDHHLRVLDHSRPELFTAKKSKSSLSKKKRKLKAKKVKTKEVIKAECLKRKLKRMKPLIDSNLMQEEGLEGGDDKAEEVEVDIDHMLQLEAADAK